MDTDEYNLDPRVLVSEPVSPETSTDTLREMSIQLLDKLTALYPDETKGRFVVVCIRPAGLYVMVGFGESRDWLPWESPDSVDGSE